MFHDPMILAIVLAVAFAFIFVCIFGFLLGWADRALFVPVDPREAAVKEALPGANCGGCGYIGCADYADAIVNKQVPNDRCPVGGVSCIKKISAIMGQEYKESWPRRPIIHCSAHTANKRGQHHYTGSQTCQGMNLVGGIQGCVYGCLGGGDCATSCAYNAIHVVDGLATVDYLKCVGCGACAKACPRRIISIIPFKADRIMSISCSNQDFGAEVTAVCDVGCIGCKACSKQANIFTMKGNLATIDYADYNPQEDVKSAITKCPRKVMLSVGKPSAKDLDEVAGETLPEIVKPNFETTVDKTEWRG